MTGRRNRLAGAMLILAVAAVPLTGCVSEAMGPAEAPTAAPNPDGAPAVHGKVFERLNELNVFDPLGGGDSGEAESDSTASEPQEPTGSTGTRKPSKG